MVKFSLSVALATSLLLLASALEFSYNLKDKKHGPLSWDKFSPKCDGRHQSPIDIKVDEVQYYELNSSFVHPSYQVAHTPARGPYINNGHAPTFIANPGTWTIQGFPDNEEQSYELFNIHTHFGHDRETGSEHSIDDVHFAGEFHLVNFNQKYGTFMEAMEQHDGLMVIAVFVEEDASNNANRSRALDKELQRCLPAVQKEGTEIRTILDPSLLPIKGSFYTYEGSLTTPGCFETVQWVVMATPVRVSPETMSWFRRLHTKEGRISDFGNFRPTQQLNGRVVKGYFSDLLDDITMD